MIWLFKSNVYWNNKPKVNEHYLFDVTDINFDITKYYTTANYFILSDSNDDEIYWIKYNGVYFNPIRYKLDISSEYYNMIKNFYDAERRDIKIKEIGI